MQAISINGAVRLAVLGVSTALVLNAAFAEPEATVKTDVSGHVAVGDVAMPAESTNVSAGTEVGALTAVVSTNDDAPSRTAVAADGGQAAAVLVTSPGRAAAPSAKTHLAAGPVAASAGQASASASADGTTNGALTGGGSAQVAANAGVVTEVLSTARQTTMTATATVGSVLMAAGSVFVPTAHGGASVSSSMAAGGAGSVSSLGLGMTSR